MVAAQWTRVALAVLPVPRVVRRVVLVLGPGAGAGAGASRTAAGWAHHRCPPLLARAQWGEATAGGAEAGGARCSPCGRALSAEAGCRQGAA
jgi:hypothetical protein